MYCIQLWTKDTGWQHNQEIHSNSYEGLCLSLHWTKILNMPYKVLVPCFMSWSKTSQKCSIHTKSLFLSNSVHKFVYITVSEHFSFAKIIHPPDRCGISRSWLNNMVVTQVHFVLGTIKGHSEICSFVTQHNATDVSSFEGACNWHADCRNVHQS